MMKTYEYHALRMIDKKKLPADLKRVLVRVDELAAVCGGVLHSRQIVALVVTMWELSRVKRPRAKAIKKGQAAR